VKYLPHIAALLVIALGVAAVVLGGADDSPGLQLIGVLLVVGTVVTAVRAGYRKRRGLR
jgi:drug/metabolite transporter (DMT)-like permease